MKKTKVQTVNVSKQGTDKVAKGALHKALVPWAPPPKK